MKDRVIQGFLKDFVDEYNIDYPKESEMFEHFINYCILSQTLSTSFDFEDIHMSVGPEVGIDGLAIIVNEHLALSESDIDFYKKDLSRLDVQFIFIQSKTSDKFDMGEIGKFLFGAKTFFSQQLDGIFNDKIRQLHRVKEYIYDSAIDFEKNPICKLYYVTLGDWQDDANLLGIINNGKKDLEDTKFFSKIEFVPIDSERLKNIYKSLRGKLVKKIKIENCAILPDIDNVKTAYIGVLPVSEYIDLICDNDKNLRRMLFYDNVRDFLGNNQVNQEIEKTLKNSEFSDQFALLNNGVTIVARSVNQTGRYFTLRDFQIVNGCQTSHVLYNNRDKLTKNIFLPVKLIATEDLDITNKIIEATNSQTEIKKEAFESLSPFQKELEQFYESFDENTGKRLYYERRSKQYERYPNIKRFQIVPIDSQGKCFLAMFLNGPHSTFKCFGNLLEQNRNQIFNQSHKRYPYYISSYANYILDRLFYHKDISNNYKLFRYHLLLVFRIQNENQILPPLNSKKIDQYCEHLANILWDPNKSLNAFKKAVQVIDSALKGCVFSKTEATKRKIFTEKIQDLANKNSLIDDAGAVAVVEREDGKVDWFSDVKGFGFIKADTGETRFVHYSKIAGKGYLYLEEGESVNYEVVETEKEYDEAQDVKVIGPRFWVNNQCNHPIKVAIRYQKPSGKWETHGWWEFNACERAHLSVGERTLILYNSTIYLYAESTDDSKITWKGEEHFKYDGDDLQMKVSTLSLNSSGDYCLGFRCDKKSKEIDK